MPFDPSRVIFDQAMPSTASRKTRSDQIASDVLHRRLRDRILTLELKPGTRLVEDELTETFGAGRTPVREALLRLQGEGLVSRGRGWIVEAADPASFRSIFEARIAIESYAARLAASRITPEAVERLAELMSDMEQERPRAEINRLNRLFHVEIVAASGNALFAEVHERTQYQYWNLRLPVVFRKEQLAQSNEQHRRIYAAVASGDGVRAEAASREHIEATMRIVAEALEDL
jgi:DNA-binding GntR family transcriptional regulator